MSHPTPGAGSAGHHTSTRRGGNQNVYQIDFTAVASGKRIANTKRRVRWRFGFTNLEALENGETGTACRGEEHDITLVWSVTSGKRLVLADGQEVHYSNNRGNTFEFSWTMRGNHVLKIIAHASAPISATNTFRQYDFFIDGQSFFTFPKVYRLGLSSRDARNANSNQIVSHADRSDTYRNYDLDGGIGTSGTGGNRSAGNIAAIEAPHNEVEEEAYLAEAIKNSLQDVKTKTPTSSAASSTAQPTTQPETALPIAAAPPAPAPAPDADLLLDFFDAPASTTPAAPLPALPPSNPAPPAQYNYAPAPVTTTAPAFAATPAVQPPQPPPQQYQPSPFDAPTATNYKPAPAPYTQPPPSDPFGPAPTASFTQPPPPPAPTSFAAPPVPPPAPPAVDPFAPKPQPPASDPFAPAPPQTTTNPLNLYSNPPPATAAAPTANGNAPLSFNTPSEPDGKISATNADQAYSNLMNGFSLETAPKKDPKTENPFDAYASGPQPTLSNLQTKKPQQTKKEVMTPSQGAMVVSNTQSGNWSGYGNPQAGQYNQQPGYNQYPQYQQSFTGPPPGSFTGPPPGYPQYQQPPPQQPPQQPNQYQNYQQQSMQSGYGNM